MWTSEGKLFLLSQYRSAFQNTLYIPPSPPALLKKTTTGSKELTNEDQHWWDSDTKVILNEQESDEGYKFTQRLCTLLPTIEFSELLSNSDPYVRELVNMTKKYKTHGLPSCLKNLTNENNLSIGNSSPLIICPENLQPEFQEQFTTENSIRCEKKLRLFHYTNLGEYMSNLKLDNIVVINTDLYTHTFPFWKWEGNVRIDIEFEWLPKYFSLQNRYTLSSFTNNDIHHDTITIKNIVCEVVSPVTYNNYLQINVVKLKCVSLLSIYDNYNVILDQNNPYELRLKKEYVILEDEDEFILTPKQITSIKSLAENVYLSIHLSVNENDTNYTLLPEKNNTRTFSHRTSCVTIQPNYDKDKLISSLTFTAISEEPINLKVIERIRPGKRKEYVESILMSKDCKSTQGNNCSLM
tara:strand:+ start:302 stop:1531 length:1230 start_codon:yes stop_codon:yes gene_type:complete